MILDGKVVVERFELSYNEQFSQSLLCLSSALASKAARIVSSQLSVAAVFLVWTWRAVSRKWLHISELGYISVNWKHTLQVRKHRVATLHGREARCNKRPGTANSKGNIQARSEKMPALSTKQNAGLGLCSKPSGVCIEG